MIWFLLFKKNATVCFVRSKCAKLTGRQLEKRPVFVTVLSKSLSLYSYSDQTASRLNAISPLTRDGGGHGVIAFHAIDTVSGFSLSFVSQTFPSTQRTKNRTCD